MDHLPTSNQVRLVEISNEQEGQRIDNFLITALKGVPRSRIYRILRKGEVRVNKKRVKQTYRLQSGDQVRIPPIRTTEQKPPPKVESVEWLESAIIYEDRHMIAINKPSGIAVHGGSGIQFGVIESFRALREEAGGYELVHRLDRATSGLLLIAKRRGALRALHQSIREQRVTKQYLALLKGRMRKGKHVTAPLQKSVLKSGERLVQVSTKGKEAESHFMPRLSCEHATLAEVEIITGRTHQIRVHGAHIHHPLAGDKRYGDDRFNRQMADMGLRRLFLHAHQIAFPHPKDETTVRLEAPLPEPLQQVLQRLQESESCRQLFSSPLKSTSSVL